MRKPKMTSTQNASHGKPPQPSRNVAAHVQQNGDISSQGLVIGAWVMESSRLAPEWKHALAHHAATHLIQYGDVIQLGSGTTFNCLMDKIIERQVRSKKAFDLIILTTNLQVLAKGRDAQTMDPSIFGTMQIVLTGGALQTSLDSLTGEYAAKGVSYNFIYPRTVFLGAAGLSFKENQLTIMYQFQDELSTQVAYATRPTSHRVILCDHKKLGKKAGWNAELSIGKLLRNTDECTFISTLPARDHPEDGIYIKTILEEEDAFLALLEPLVSNEEYSDKNVAFRLIDKDGAVKREHSLSALRERSAKKATKE